MAGLHEQAAAGKAAAGKAVTGKAVSGGICGERRDLR